MVIFHFAGTTRGDCAPEQGRPRHPEGRGQRQRHRIIRLDSLPGTIERASFSLLATHKHP